MKKGREGRREGGSLNKDLWRSWKEGGRECPKAIMICGKYGKRGGVRR